MTVPIDPEVFYPPASFFLLHVPGRTGWGIAFMQAIVGMPSRWTHAGIIGPGGRTYEAAPGGVHEGHVDDLQGRAHIVCDAPVQEAMAAAAKNLDPEEVAILEKQVRKLVVEQAALLLGTPYSFLDYVALALHHLAPKARITARVRKRVEDSKHLICSAYVDRVYARAAEYASLPMIAAIRIRLEAWAQNVDHPYDQGADDISRPVAAALHLYKDRRLSGDVSPSDLGTWVDDHNHIIARQKAGPTC